MNKILYLLMLIIILIIFLICDIYISIYFNIFNSKNILLRNRIIKKCSPFFDYYEFDNIYENITSKVNIDELKNEHKNNYINILKTLGLFLLSYFLIFVANFVKIDVIELSLMCFAFVLILKSAKSFHPKKITIYKKEIIQNLISSINNKIQYKNDYDIWKIQDELYTQAKFEKDSSDIRKRLTDYVEYALNSDTLIKLADIKIKKEIRHSSIHKFEGIITKIPKKDTINNQILIKRKKILLKKISSNQTNFDTYFKTYHINSQDTNNILTENTKETLTQLYEEYGIPFEISIINNSLYIRFFTGPLFESSWKPSFSSNKEKLYGDYIIFKTVLELIEKINNLIKF